MKNKIKKIIDKIISYDYKAYCENNILFLTFLFASTINGLLVRILTVGNFLDIRPIIADMAIITIVGAFGYLIKPKKRIIYYLIWSIIYTAICVINSMYYTNYLSYASISLIATSFLIVDVGDAIVENVMELKDFCYIWEVIIIILVHIKLCKSKYYEKQKEKKSFTHTLIAGFIFVAIFATTLRPVDISRITKQWNREYIVMRYGIFTYQFSDIFASVTPTINSMFGYDENAKIFREYYEENKEKHEPNEYTNIFEGKNVIVIHGESMMTNAIGLKFNDQEVTPTLNRLSQEGMFFSNFYSQVSVGTSSDSELTFNTSLMPTKSGTAFVSYSNRKYIGIPTLLKEKGYYTFSMHANNADFWNRRAMHNNLGYNRFYSKKDYEVLKENIIGLGLSDKEFFKQSIEKIEKISQENEKWYGLLIMLSNHTPFSEVEKYGDFPVDIKEKVTKEDGTEEEITYPYMEGTKLGNYFKSIHYADAALNEFLIGMDEKGLLDNTVFILYGDHDARLPRSDYNRLYNYDKENNTTLDKDDPNYKEYDSYQYE